MEPLQLAVGLGPVGPGSLVLEVQDGADLTPGVRAVAGAVVRHHPLDVDAVLGVPGHGPTQDPDRSGGLLVGADLDVGQARMVVDDGMEVGGAGARLVAASGQSGGSALVLRALPAADEAVAAAVGDVAELGDVDVDQRPGMVVLVAADRLPSDPIDPDSRFSRQRTRTAWTVGTGMPSRPPIWTGPSQCRHRSATI